jgi:hypothetical protein
MNDPINGADPSGLDGPGCGDDLSEGCLHSDPLPYQPPDCNLCGPGLPPQQPAGPPRQPVSVNIAYTEWRESWVSEQIDAQSELANLQNRWRAGSIGGFGGWVQVLSVAEKEAIAEGQLAYSDEALQWIEIQHNTLGRDIPTTAQISAYMAQVAGAHDAVDSVVNTIVLALVGSAGSGRPVDETPRGRAVSSTVDPATGQPVGRFVVDPRGNAMIEPKGGSTVPAGRAGVDTHTLYPNGANYQRLNPVGHGNNQTPHGHGHLQGTGTGIDGQGPSIDRLGNPVPWNSSAAHWPIR